MLAGLVPGTNRRVGWAGEGGRSPRAHRGCPRSSPGGRGRGAGAAGGAVPLAGGTVRLRSLLRLGGGPRRGGRGTGRPGASHRLRGGGGGRRRPRGRVGAGRIALARRGPRPGR